MSDPTETPAADTRDFTQTSFAIADATGLITVTGSVPAFMIGDQVTPAGGTLTLGLADITTDYVLKGAIVKRPTNPTTLTGMTLSNVPNPSTIVVDGQNKGTCTDGTVELSFTQASTYSITVSGWPYLDASFSVTQS